MQRWRGAKLKKAMLVMGLFAMFFIPETKNIPIEEMAIVWRAHWFWKKIVDCEEDDASMELSGVKVVSNVA